MSPCWKPHSTYLLKASQVACYMLPVLPWWNPALMTYQEWVWRILIIFSTIILVFLQAYIPQNCTFSILLYEFYGVFLWPIHRVAFQQGILPATGGKAFNTRQQAKSCRMRQATRQHVAACRMPQNRMLHVAFCWTGGNTLSPGDNVACHKLPECCLGGIAP